MNGRWWIPVDEHGPAVQALPGRGCMTPVVPCDDAAVERAVDALSQDGILDDIADSIGGDGRDMLDDAARIVAVVLRAAGEVSS